MRYENYKLILGILLFVGHLQAMDETGVALPKIGEAKRISMLFLDLFFKNITDDKVRLSVQSNLCSISSSIDSAHDYKKWYNAVKGRFSDEQKRCNAQVENIGRPQDRLNLDGVNSMWDYFQKEFGWVWMPCRKNPPTDLNVARLEANLRDIEEQVKQRKNEEDEYSRQYRDAGSNLLKKTYENLSKRNFACSVAGVGILHTIARRPVVQRNPLLHRVATGMQFLLGVNGAVQLGMAMRRTHNQVQSTRNSIRQEMENYTKGIR